jgi:hypothetical protein
MDRDEKRPGKAAKRPARKESVRDMPAAPTAKQIEQSISKGTSVPLADFVKGVKL